MNTGNSRRMAKAAQAVKEVVGLTILTGLRDPRIKNVTVIAAEVSADMRTAKVYVSVMGGEKTEALTLKGLDSAKGFIQAKVADRLQTRYTPVLTFVIDRGVKRSIEASRVLREALGPDDEGTTVSDADDVGGEEE